MSASLYANLQQGVTFSLVLWAALLMKWTTVESKRVLAAPDGDIGRSGNYVVTSRRHQ